VTEMRVICIVPIYKRPPRLFTKSDGDDNRTKRGLNSTAYSHTIYLTVYCIYICIYDTRISGILYGKVYELCSWPNGIIGIIIIIIIISIMIAIIVTSDPYSELVVNRKSNLHVGMCIFLSPKTPIFFTNASDSRIYVRYLYVINCQRIF